MHIGFEALVLESCRPGMSDRNGVIGEKLGVYDGRCQMIMVRGDVQAMDNRKTISKASKFEGRCSVDSLL